MEGYGKKINSLLHGLLTSKISHQNTKIYSSIYNFKIYEGIQ